MNAYTKPLTLTGAAGDIEALLDAPQNASRGMAVIAHPHPLFAGTMHNKVVQTLARAFVQAGWTAVRFNFRGVGASAGVHDEGRGEVQDYLSVVQQLAPSGPLAVAGFSFGAFVCCEALQSLWNARDIQRIVLVGTATSRFNVPALPGEAHDCALVIHGERDHTVALQTVMDWARPQALPVTVMPGVEHFFHGHLPLLKRVVLRHVR